MLELPTSFGKYYLTDKIATGGMAEIFLAKLIGPGGFEKPLIIKQIHPELSGQHAFVDLFVAEAKTLVSLGHGNIVPIYELGVIDDVYFIAMEFIDGPTLRELGKALAAAGQTMTPASAAYVCAKILEGLDYAHRKGVIHRDVSPRNVMLSRDGEVKLLDFGIAVHEEQAGDLDQRPAGSFPYMSPEQVRGQTLTPRSDLFATGILFWEMLTGQDLFARPTAEDTLRAVTDATIDAPSRLRPGTPRLLDEICLHALARDPDDRYGNAAEFLAALNRYLYSLDELVTPTHLSRLVALHCPPVVRRADDALPADHADYADGTAAFATTQRRPAAGRITGRHGTVKLADRAPASDAGRPGTVRLADRAAASDAGRPGTIDLSGRDPGRPGTVEVPRGKVHRREDAVPEPVTPAGEGTRPLPGRSPGSRRRRRRPSTVRTFATHADFERVLSEARSISPGETEPRGDEHRDAPAEPRKPARDEAAPKTDGRGAADDAHERAGADAHARADADDADRSGAAGSADEGPGTAGRTGYARPSTARPRAERLMAVSLPEVQPRKPWPRRAALATIALAVVAASGLAITRCGAQSAPGVSPDAADRADADATPGAAPLRAVPAPAPDAAPDAAHAVRRPPDRVESIDRSPTTDDRDPTTDDRGSTTGDRNPTTGDRNPTTDNRDSTTGDRNPTTDDRDPVTSPGRLKVGANPWAEVYVDGRKLGRAPNSWPVAPGRHQIEVVFPVAGREQKRSFEVTVEAGKTASLGVIDFSDDL